MVKIIKKEKNCTENVRPIHLHTVPFILSTYDQICESYYTFEIYNILNSLKKL